MPTRFYKNAYKCFKSLEDYDIFGIPISVKLEGKEKHKSFIGFLATVTIFIGIFLQLFSDISILFQYDFFFEESIVKAPSSFLINPQDFIFALGIQNYKKEFIQDESFFQVSAQFIIEKKILNNQTQYYEDEMQQIEIQLVKCSDSHFQRQNMTNYIGLKQIDKLFCLPIDSQLQLEGQLGANIFKWLKFKVTSCVSSTLNKCQEKQEIKNQLNNGGLFIYFMNYFIDLSNSTSAFQPNPQYLAYRTLNDTQKRINVQFRKTKIKTDNSLIYSNKMVEEKILFSQDNYQVKDYNENTKTLFQIDLTLEKNKESLYTRSYTRLITYFSKIGGFFNFLYSVCLMLCYPFSKILFRQKLLNSIFSFQNKEQLEMNGFFDNQQQIQQIEQPTHTQKIIANTPHASSIDYKMSRKNTFQNLTDSQANFRKQTNTFLQNCSSSMSHNYAGNSQEEQSQQIKTLKLKIPSINDQAGFQAYANKSRSNKKNVTIINLNDFKKNILSKRKTLFKSSDYINQKIIASFFNTTYNQFKVRFIDIFMSYFCKSRAKSQMISYGLHKLNYHLDINTIITKLLELEKLKRLLLDKDQIKLFEFIPKPIIHEEQFDRETMNGITEHQSFAISNTGILYEDKRNIAQKAKDAEEAYHRIINQSKQSDIPINRKLLQLIDPRISSQFQQNTFSKNYECFTTSNFEINKELSKESSKEFKENKDSIATPSQKQRSNFFSNNFNESIKD